MKTKSIIRFAAMCVLLLNFHLNAQSTFRLVNRLSCDVTVNYELGDPTGCSPNVPCSFGSLTIGAGSFLNLPACGTGVIWELCIVLVDIGGSAIIPGVHSNSGLGCCNSCTCWNVSGPAPAGCSSSGAWNITRNATSWTIRP